MENIAKEDSNDTIGRILVVDDEAELMSALCEMLADQGYETAGFLNADEALAVLKEQEFDLMLTDLMMPGMNGIDLIRAGLEIDPNLIGIVMTGHGTVQTAVEAMKTGACDYILKPFKLNTLLPLLSRAMQMRNLRLENMQLKETVAIHELGKVIALSSDLNSILNKIADTAIQQCIADEVSIMLPTKDEKELYVAVVRGGNTENLGKHTPIEQGIAGWVALNRESLVLRGAVNDPRMAPIQPRANIHTAISMPMISRGKLVGVLNVSITKSQRPFTVGQLKALSILVSIISPILENTSLYIQIRKAEEKYRSIFENAHEGIFRSLLLGQRFITANPALARIFGYDSPEQLVASVTDIARQIYVNPDDAGELSRIMEAKGEIINFERQVYRKNGSRIWISLSAHTVSDEKGTLQCLEGIIEDITERKNSELRLKLSKEVLDMLNRPKDTQEIINDILHLLKKNKNFEAIGIRLREEEDYPYYMAIGFPDHFLKTQNSLCTREAAGEMISDSNSNPQLECVCRNILNGRTDPSLPFFTEGGSFWTNNATMFLTLTAKEECPCSMKNLRNQEGYESIAMIPLRSGNEIIGLLQLNDTRQNIFTPDMIHFLEGIGASIGIAVARRRFMEKLRQSELSLRNTMESLVKTVATIVETRDPYTAGHQRRVADLALAIASEMDLTANEIAGIQIAGLIHDIGKMSVPAEILSKPTKLTGLEFALIKEHAQAGYDILKEIKFPWPIARIVLEHHERMDGSGYPQGLSGEQTLKASRILTVADVVEAMASHRPYRPGLGIDIALDEIEKNRGALYDPEVVDACLRLFREKGYTFKNTWK